MSEALQISAIDKTLPSGDVRRRLSCRNRAGFTLIELLMVIGIIGLVMSVAIPFFNGIGQGTKLDTATTELKFALQLARQHAITRRERVYVVFPNDDAAFSSQGVSNIAFRAYAVCTTNEYIRDWAFLPAGLFFDPNYPSAASLNAVFNHANYQTPVPGRWSGNQPAIVFRSDGSLLNRGAYPEISVAEGTLLGGTVNVRTNASNSIQVYGLTGMPQVHKK